MKNTTSNIAFWVLDAQKLDSAFIYENLDSTQFKNILQELVTCYTIQIIYLRLGYLKIMKLNCSKVKE